jgi:hypothetical protein
LECLGQVLTLQSKPRELELNALKKEPRIICPTFAQVSVLFGVDDVAAVSPDKLGNRGHHARLIRARKKKNCCWSHELQQYGLQQH